MIKSPGARGESKVGIVGYGAYVPHYFLSCEDLHVGSRNLGLVKKALASWDEDSVTMAAEAGKTALEVAGIGSQLLGSVYAGSESPPYAVNPMSTIVADILNVGSIYRAVDLQFACKAATAGIQMAMGEVGHHHHDYALIVGSDKAQARPGDVLELSAGAAAAAVVIGRERVLAHVLETVSVTSDTPDFWRRAHQYYPEHGGRFTGEPAYFHHILSAAKAIMKKSGLMPKDFAYAVFHMPNGRFPVDVAKQLGFDLRQVEPFLTVKEVGNPYSASAMLGLCAVLEVLRPGEKVLMVAYGSGAGADAMIWEGTSELVNRRWGGLRERFDNRLPVTVNAYRERWRWE